MLIVSLEVLNDDIGIAVEVARNDSATFISLSLFQQIFPQSFWYFSSYICCCFFCNFIESRSRWTWLLLSTICE